MDFFSLGKFFFEKKDGIKQPLQETAKTKPI